MKVFLKQLKKVIILAFFKGGLVKLVTDKLDGIVYRNKIGELMKKHGLGFVHNPGGGEFNGKGVRIQIHMNNDKDDYEKLKEGLIKSGLEDAEV